VFKNEDLPDGCLDGNIWRRSYIPTYLVFAANYRDPWSIEEGSAITAMQTVFDSIYRGKIEVDIDSDGPVYYIVSISRTVWSVLTCFFRPISVSMNGAVASAPLLLRCSSNSLRKTIMIPMTAVSNLPRSSSVISCFSMKTPQAIITRCATSFDLHVYLSNVLYFLLCSNGAACSALRLSCKYSRLTSLLSKGARMFPNLEQ